MTIEDAAVLAAAAVAIALVNWYFLFRTPAAVHAVTTGGVQAIDVLVDGGYAPALIEVDRGRPVRLTFDRREDNPCSEEVVIPAYGIRRYLPAFERTAVELTPVEAGDVDVTCGMSMLHLTVRVR